MTTPTLDSVIEQLNGTNPEWMYRMASATDLYDAIQKPVDQQRQFLISRQEQTVCMIMRAIYLVSRAA